jgi:hypothetical protein
LFEGFYRFFYVELLRFQRRIIRQAFFDIGIQNGAFLRDPPQLEKQNPAKNEVQSYRF